MVSELDNIENVVVVEDVVNGEVVVVKVLSFELSCSWALSQELGSVRHFPLRGYRSGTRKSQSSSSCKGVCSGRSGL